MTPIFSLKTSRIENFVSVRDENLFSSLQCTSLPFLPFSSSCHGIEITGILYRFVSIRSKKKLEFETGNLRGNLVVLD